MAHPAKTELASLHFLILSAEPAEAAVQEPPSTGEVGRELSPIFAVTSAIFSPSASAPIWVRMV